MDLNLKGKTALITASSRGLGKAIATRLENEGARVVLNARDEKDLNGLLTELNTNSSGHKAFCMDLTEERASQKLYEFLVKEDLIPDIVIHNLGGNLNITDPLCSVEDWHKVMNANLYVAIALNNMLIPHMKERSWGRLCHISSISALENHGPPSYCAAKAALTAYVRSMGRYVASFGIVATSVLPGAVFTQKGYWDEAAKARPEHVEKFLKERMAIQRFGQPNEIADIVAFLCSGLSTFCIGSAFLADGGQGRVFYQQE